MNKIKAAIVGLGRIASLLEDDALREKPCTHAGAIAANKDCFLTAGCDIDEERRKIFAKKWAVPVYDNAFEMLCIQAPQIFVIATHPDSHYYYCRLAAECKVPVIICEKPLADNVGLARKISNLSQRQNSPVIITNHERRYSQDYIRAKAVLEEETLGRLLSVRSVLYMGRNKRLLDVFWHDGTHLADAIMFLANATLKHRKCWGAKLTDTTGTAWLEGELHREKPVHSVPASKETGAGKEQAVPAVIPVIMEIGAGRDHLVFETEFSCEKGKLRVGNNVFEIWESAPSPYAEQFRSLRQSGEVFTGPTGYFANMVKDAVACANDPNRLPISSAADGLRVIEYLNSVKAWR